jgi:hypothetical protein
MKRCQKTQKTKIIELSLMLMCVEVCFVCIFGILAHWGPVTQICVINVKDGWRKIAF